MRTELPEIILRRDIGLPFEAIVDLDLDQNEARRLLDAGEADAVETPELPERLVLQGPYKSVAGATHPLHAVLQVGAELSRPETLALLRARVATPAPARGPWIPA